MRAIATLVGAVLMVGGVGPATGPLPGPMASVAGPMASVAYAAPLTPMRVVRAFDPPATRYGRGHLGVDLAATTGAAVLSAADGLVRFAGLVAGRGLVVVQHSDGVSTEYEPLRVAVHAGATVRRGAVLGRVRGVHAPCAAGRCLHWGARRDDQYLDPLLLLRPLGPVRLLPWTG